MGYWQIIGGARVNVLNVTLHPTPRPRSAPEEVTSPFREDFEEAARVLAVSAKASAALSRRLLQRIILERAGIRGRNLDKEIDAVIESGTLPADLATDLDALRTVGNFAAHPIKVEHTGEVADVEPGEAEWLLDVLDELLEFYFVRPARRAAKRGALNVKLEASGKPSLKGTATTPKGEDGEEDEPPTAILEGGR